LSPDGAAYLLHFTVDGGPRTPNFDPAGASDAHPKASIVKAAVGYAILARVRCGQLREAPRRHRLTPRIATALE
jgi:hypothetical protein